MKELSDFNAQMLNFLLKKISSEKIDFSDVTNWHPSHPYYRLTYYDKVILGQVLGIYLLFNKDWLSNFDNIIEIGLYNGGLSSYIFDSKEEKTTFVSYDIAPEINEAAKKRNDIDFRIGDCFEEKYTNEIIELINKPGKTLMICDGGNKTKEFNLFSKYLKSNDVIILHDYKHTAESWKMMAEYWQWPYGFETSYDEIKDAVIENDLKEYRNEEFNFFAWGSYIKK
jgi:hypothetical protein